MTDHNYTKLYRSGICDCGFTLEDPEYGADYQENQKKALAWSKKFGEHVVTTTMELEEEPQLLATLPKQRVTWEYWLYHITTPPPSQDSQLRTWWGTMQDQQNNWHKLADQEHYNFWSFRRPWILLLKKSNGLRVHERFGSKREAKTFLQHLAQVKTPDGYQIELQFDFDDFGVSAPPLDALQYVHDLIAQVDKIKDIKKAQQVSGRITEIENLMPILSEKKAQMWMRVTDI